jgi:hypothetical protein
MGQTQTIGRTATKVEHRGLETFVRYHNTDVVQFDSLYITLDTGGWETATTKLRMNQTSNQFNLGFSVYQKDFQWFVVIPQGETVEFTGRRMTFPRR